jgi:DNA-binding winged helix-turn-helix (wHTH) protein/TolB-like protein/Flp pilus assembly protein TadD
MDLDTRHLYCFGPFQLDRVEGLLLRDGEPVPLTPKAFDILTVLVQNNRRLMTKNDLMRAVWPDTFVEEANLSVNISALRRALGEGREGKQYIETVPRRGYRFNAQVEELRCGRDGLGEREPSVGGKIAEGVSAVPQGDRLGDVTRRVGARDQGKPSATETLEEAQSLPAVSLPVAPQAGSPKTRPLPLMAKPSLALLAMVLIALGYYAYRRQTAGTRYSPRPRSLAILPFRNLKQDADSDFLGFSLADAVITKLAYVSALTVRPSSAVEKYRNQVIDMRKVAADLNVDTLLTGNFIRDGNHLRITSQLVDVKTEKILWKGAFDLEYPNLLSVQDNVTEKIIKGLELSLSPSEVERLKPDELVDPLAYEYYLRGVDLYSRSDFAMAIKMLEKSIELDPNYAQTWAHLGQSYTASASFQLGGREQYREAQAAYEQALALQPAQIEAHIYMANLLTDTGRVEQAVPLLRNALRTNPNHAEARWELGYAYRFAGMLKESVAECERARQLDPGVKINSSALNAYLYLGRYKDFVASLPETTDSAFILFYRGFGEYYQKEWEEAAKDFHRAFELDPSLLQARVGMAFSDAIAGQNSEGVEMLNETEKKIEQRGVGDPEAIYKIAEAYTVLGDKASALRVLQHSIDNGFFPYPYFTVDPLLDGLRKEPEFARLMQRASQRYQAFKSTF